MKKYIFTILSGTLFNGWSIITKKKESRSLERFDKVNLEGNIELHLEENSSNSIEIRTRKTSNLGKLVTEVRNGELYIYREKKYDKGRAPKYIIYLSHLGISDLTLTGVIKLISNNVIAQKDLVIKGGGVFRGSIEVFVENLSVNLGGISNVSISGNADVATIKMTGIGRINAKNLETKSAKKRANGIAIVRLLTH